MKKFVLGLSLLSVLLPTVAQSAPTANIKVTSNMTPPTCNVSGDGDSLAFDFGRVLPSSIPQDEEYMLPSISSVLTIVCDATTYLTYTMSDTYPIGSYFNQYSPRQKYGVYGLVEKETGKEVGGVSFLIKNPTVDGNAAFISTTSENDIWSADALVQGRTASWTRSNQSNSVALPADLDLFAGKQFSMTIQSYTGTDNGHSFIKPQSVLTKDGIDISNGLDFTGQAVMTFNFGV